VLSYDSRFFFLSCWRRRGTFPAAKHETENGQRQLRVALRQLFGLLAKQATLESLVFLTQVRGELLVLVALALSFL